MLDAIPGPSMRDKTIVYLGSVLNWYAARVDDFVPPVLRGLKGKKIARERLLDHDEIRELWPAFGAAHLPSFGVLCKLLLLTCGTYGQVVRVIPPLVTTDEEVETAIGVISESLAAVGA